MHLISRIIHHLLFFSCTSRPVCILSVSVFVLQVLGLLAGRWRWLSILRGLSLYILLLSSMLLRPFLSGGLHRFLPMLQLCRVRAGVRLQLGRKRLRLLHVRPLSTDGRVSGARHGTLSASVSLAAQSHCHLYTAHDYQIRPEWNVANVMCWFHKHVNLLVDCGYDTARLHLILHFHTASEEKCICCLHITWTTIYQNIKVFVQLIAIWE